MLFTCYKKLLTKKISDLGDKLKHLNFKEISVDYMSFTWCKRLKFKTLKLISWYKFWFCGMGNCFVGMFCGIFYCSPLYPGHDYNITKYTGYHSYKWKYPGRQWSLQSHSGRFYSTCNRILICRGLFYFQSTLPVKSRLVRFSSLF